MPEGSIPPESQIEGITVSPSAAKRVAKLIEMEGAAGLRLRVEVSGGGCSGFQYGFSLDAELAEDDRLFAQDGIEVVVDETSLELLKGAELTYKEELIGSYFAFENPNASSTCGCGTSFSI